MKHLRDGHDFEVLSPLEQDVLGILWPDKSLHVRDIYRQLRPKRKVALTSIAVILDRLFEQGVVNRKIETAPGGLRYLYFPTKDRKQFEKSVVEETVNRLIDKFGDVAVSYFNERFMKSRK